MLIVKKFGGSSVADKERIFNVAKRCIEDTLKYVLNPKIKAKAIVTDTLVKIVLLTLWRILIPINSLSPIFLCSN